MRGDSLGGSASGPLIRVLGPVSLQSVRAAEEVPSLLGPRLRRLLAALAARANTVVPVDTVADALWGDEQPGAPEAALHTLVSRLRAALRTVTSEQAEDDTPALLTRAPGYVLRVGPTDLDAALFEMLARRGRSELAEDPASAVLSLTEALALWRGPAYAEFADEDFVRPEAARLDEQHASGTEDYADALLAVDRPGDAIPLLESLLAREALLERALGQLMLARYRCGQQGEALDVFRSYQELLADELGLDPSPSLQRLHQDILRQHPDLDASPVPAQPVERKSEDPAAPPEGSAPRAGNLPAVPPVLIGRDPDLDALADAARPGSVLTLVGPGGVGKTTLATRLGVDIADRFTDGAWFCDLSSLTSEDDLPLAVMSSLDLRTTAGTDHTASLLAHLRSRCLLLILDNCEHVLGSAATLTQDVHRGCPDVAVLATSRAALEVTDEWVWPVPPLSLPAPGSLGGVADMADVAAAPAVQLFVARTRRRVEYFELGDRNAEAVAEICRRLDGLPLAIELAAARMGAISPTDLVERLSWRFRLLHGGVRTGSERHRTLRALIDWSFDLLDEDHQRVFAVLSVFAGSFALQDAERLVLAVPGLAPSFDDAQVADIVLGLVDRSMLSVSRDDHRRRYSLLETLRAYGRQQLEADPLLHAAQQAHAQMVVGLTTDAAARLYGPDHVAASSTISGYLDELRAAHAWATTNDLELAARLVGSLMLYVEHRMPVEVQQWAERTIRAAEVDGPPPGLAGVYAVAAACARFTGDLSHAAQLADRGLQLSNEPVTTGYLRTLLAEVALFEGRLDDVERHRREVELLATTAELGAVALLAELLGPLVAAYRGDGASASGLAEELESRAAEQGAGPIEAWARYLRAEALLDTDPERAADLLDGALELARDQGDRYASGVAMVSAASVRGRHGDPEAAVPLYRDVIEHWSSLGDWTHQWTSLRGVVEVLLRLGRDEDAALLRGGLVDRTMAAPIFGPDAERMAAAEALLRQRLGDDLFSELSARGARMGDDDVVSFARHALTPASPGRSGDQRRR